jgi:hypothetical protein
LRGLVAPAKQEDQERSLLDVVDPVSRAIVDPKFTYPVADGSNIAGISVSQPIKTRKYLGLASAVGQLFQPLRKDRRFLAFERQRHASFVAYALQTRKLPSLDGNQNDADFN